MQIIQLTKEDFDEFAIKHKNSNFYQTSQYGTLMSHHGYFDDYVGLSDDNNNIIAASLILTQKKFGNFKSGYAPRGFLIDFDDYDLVNIFTKLLKQHLFRLGYLYIKIDPNIIHIERCKDGKPKHGGINNNHIIDYLKKLGYEHKGFNFYFEALKPRWNAITKLDGPSNYLYKSFSKSTKNKIRKSFKKGVKIYKGNKEDLKLFYNFISKKHTRKLNYYTNMYDILSKDNMIELYFAKLDPATYIKTSKELYDNELKRNSELTELVQKNTHNHIKNNYVNLKINSDQLLNTYKQDVINSNKIFRSYPKGIVIAASAVIKYDNEIFFLIDGYNPKFKSFCANHLMKWAIINEYIRKGFHYAHHNGITGNFNKDNSYYGLFEFKKGFNSDVIEYIGEFDLIINKQLYNTYLNFKFIKNLFEFKK